MQGSQLETRGQVKLAGSAAIDQGEVPVSVLRRNTSLDTGGNLLFLCFCDYYINVDYIMLSISYR